MYKPLKDTFVIGLGHKARNGKGTTTDVFLDLLGGAGREFAFADALKSYCRAVRGMTVKDGPLLQRVGTDEFRKNDPGVWVRTTYYTIEEKQPKVAIISDVRFSDEAQMVKDMGGIMIKCVRRNADGTQFIDPSRPADHPSETALDDYNFWDYELEADSVPMLEALATELFEDINNEFGLLPNEFGFLPSNYL